MESEQGIHLRRLATRRKLKTLHQEERLFPRSELPDAGAQWFEFVNLILRNHDDAPPRTWLMNDSHPRI